MAEKIKAWLRKWSAARSPNRSIEHSQKLLSEAIPRARIEVVRRLMKADSRVALEGTPLHDVAFWAGGVIGACTVSSSRNEDCSGLLLKLPAYLGMIRLFVDVGADVQSRNREGETPFDVFRYAYRATLPVDLRQVPIELTRHGDLYRMFEEALSAQAIGEHESPSA